MEFLIGCGSSVAADAGNSLLSKIKKHIGYLFSYNNNKKGLEDARVNLKAKISDASKFVDDANNKFKSVSSSVTHWQNEVEKLHKEAETIITQNNKRRSSCPNPWSRYSSSKNAWELTQKIIEKVQNAPDFGTTFNCPAPNPGNAFNLTGLMEFDSRRRILNGVLEALKDEKVRMCSICGMGGVGKTTLVKKLIKQVEVLHLFDKVAMVTVSQNVNLEVIQREIIGQMGLEIKDDSEQVRANRLKGWLENNKILLVLDDVWTKLTNDDFEKVGIPLDSKGCKMVFTSRNEDECKKMGSQRNFLADFLKPEEAWDLFREKAGKCIDDLNFHEIARNIAAQCGGLPIAIVTIATSLKDKPLGVWNHSLLQLQKSNLSGISDMEKVYSRIKLSYDLLDNQEAQSCFLLCSLFPEDHDIPISYLVSYGKSLDLFGSLDTVKEARDRVETIIHNLKTSFLLLDGNKYHCVKMHDIMRDCAVSISSKSRDPYLIKCDRVDMETWPETSKYKNFLAISIMCKKMLSHPVDLECPKLELLRLDFDKESKRFQGGIFDGMKELKVLWLNVPTMLQALTVQKKLRALFVSETSDRWGRSAPEIGPLIGDHLMNLEFFSFSTRRPCKDFPVEIGILCNLRVLTLSGMSFQYIPPGVLPKLVKLEELYLPRRFMDWGREESGTGRINASLDEIESLPLTGLKIAVRNGSVLAEKFVQNFTRFQVFVGRIFNSDHVGGELAKTFLEVLQVDACEVTSIWISALQNKCESLNLIGVNNLKNINCMQVGNNNFQQLKKLYIRECKEMEYLVDRADPWTSSSFSQLESLKLFRLYNLKEICHVSPNVSKIEAPSSIFCNLIRVSISQCAKLKSGFPLSVARGLSRVERITIRQCDEMDCVIFSDEEHDDNNQQVGAISVFSPKPEATSTLDPTKAKLICPTPRSIIRGLLGSGKQPKSVPNQEQAEGIGAKGDEKKVDVIMDDAVTIFPQLKVLKLRKMPKLKVFYDGNRAIILPSLESLRIDECNEMKAFSYGSCSTPILRQMQINKISYPVREDTNAFLKELLKDEAGDDEIRDA